MTDIKICVSIKTFEKHTFNEMIKYVDEALWKSEKFRDVFIFDFEDLSPKEEHVYEKQHKMTSQFNIKPNSSEASSDPSQTLD